jgi:hypothetical protein
MDTTPTPGEIPPWLTSEQLDGIACVVCGAEDTGVRPVTVLNRTQLFACTGHPDAYALLRVPADAPEQAEVLGLHTTRKAARIAGYAAAEREFPGGEFLWSFERLGSVPGAGPQQLVRLLDDHRDENTAYQLHPWAIADEQPPPVPTFGDLARRAARRTLGLGAPQDRPRPEPTLASIAERLGVTLTDVRRTGASVYKDGVFARRAARYDGESDESLLARILRNYLHPASHPQEWDLVIRVLSGSSIAAVPATEPEPYIPARGDAVETWLQGLREKLTNDAAWGILNALCLAYGAHASTRTPLDEPLPRSDDDTEGLADALAAEESSDAGDHL